MKEAMEAFLGQFDGTVNDGRTEDRGQRTERFDDLTI
jgi:hypothetical protein